LVLSSIHGKYDPGLGMIKKIQEEMEKDYDNVMEETRTDFSDAYRGHLY
jgi:hypothetical protein